METWSREEKNKAQSSVQHSTLHRRPLCCNFPGLSWKVKFGSKSRAAPLLSQKLHYSAETPDKTGISVQLQNQFWVPQWISSGDFSFPKDTSRSTILTGVLVLDLTFKNGRMTSASGAAERWSLQKANCETSEGAVVSLVMTVPILTKSTFPLSCILGQISILSISGMIDLGSLVPGKESGI